MNLKQVGDSETRFAAYVGGLRASLVTWTEPVHCAIIALV